MPKNYDFCGWATRNNLLCDDGRVIMKDAFKDQDGETVPLVWNHVHDDPLNVLGHAVLKNHPDGVKAYCYLNEDTENGKAVKNLLRHGDVTSLSIWANNLKQIKQNGAKYVQHGVIRELSVVLSGANQGARIEDISFAHGVDVDDEAIIYTGEGLEIISHSGIKFKKKDEDEDDETDEMEKGVSKEDSDMDDKKKKNEEPKTDEKENSEKTVKDVFDTLNEEQKTVVYALIGEAIEQNKKSDGNDDEEEEDKVKHNVFDNDSRDNREYLSHAAQEEIIELAKNKQVGTFQNALDIYMEDNNLQHDGTVGGFSQTNGSGTYGVTALFPEYAEVRPGAPELITNEQGWIGTVMNKVHKSPISRIRTSQVDIRNIDGLRGKGYKKGTQKKISANFNLIRRTTDPQTVYVKNALHRDDIVDITDFDYVQYLYNIDRMMLNEELAMAIMLGDGRDDGAEDKIAADHIRPIWLDDELYTIHVDLDTQKMKQELQGTNTGANFGDNYVMAEAMIQTLLYAREDFRGTGTPDLYITPHTLNQMLLARDMNGRRIYASISELATALNVGSIQTAEQFEGKTRKTTDDTPKTKKILALMVNLADYSLGATKGGEVTHFTQFDIDFNQEKSLLETRVSGALTRVYSAVAVEQVVTG